MDDDEVENTDFEYSTRGPDDWVASGPLGDAGVGSGRRFADIREAAAWAKEFYGARFKGVIPESAREGVNRWAVLVKGPRGAK